MGCSGLLSTRCCSGGEARLAEGCSIVEDSVNGSLWSCWTQPSATLGGKTRAKEITVLHQCLACSRTRVISRSVATKADKQSLEGP